MALDALLILLAIFTLLSSIFLFFSRKLIHSVLFLALASSGSALIFLYLGQVLVALLQLLVFVGGLSTYLIVAVAAEGKRTATASKIRFLVSAVVLTIGLTSLVYGAQSAQPNANDFTTYAQTAFSTYYAFLFASVFLLFATAVGSIVIIKKFSKMIV